MFKTNRSPIWRGRLKLHFSFDEQQRGNIIVKGKPGLQKKCELLCIAQWPVIFSPVTSEAETHRNPNLKNLYNQNPYSFKSFSCLKAE